MLNNVPSLSDTFISFFAIVLQTFLHVLFNNASNLQSWKERSGTSIQLGMFDTN